MARGLISSVSADDADAFMSGSHPAANPNYDGGQSGYADNPPGDPMAGSGALPVGQSMPAPFKIPGSANNPAPKGDETLEAAGVMTPEGRAMPSTQASNLAASREGMNTHIAYAGTPGAEPQNPSTQTGGKDNGADVLRPVTSVPINFHGYTNTEETAPYQGDAGMVDRGRAKIHDAPKHTMVPTGMGEHATREDALAAFDANHPKGTLTGFAGNTDPDQIFGVSEQEKNYSDTKFVPDKLDD